MQAGVDEEVIVNTGRRRRLRQAEAQGPLVDRRSPRRPGESNPSHHGVLLLQISPATIDVPGWTAFAEASVQYFAAAQSTQACATAPQCRKAADCCYRLSGVVPKLAISQNGGTLGTTRFWVAKGTADGRHETSPVRASGEGVGEKLPRGEPQSWLPPIRGGMCSHVHSPASLWSMRRRSSSNFLKQER